MSTSEHVGRLAALVTGGSRGVGAATAVALAGVGFDVAIGYRNKASRAESVAAQIEAIGRRALPVGGDLTREDERTALLAALGAGRMAWMPSS